MFNGSLIWRGLFYSVLMTAAKLVCGIWLIRFSLPTTRPNIPLPRIILNSSIVCFRGTRKGKTEANGGIELTEATLEAQQRQSRALKPLPPSTSKTETPSNPPPVNLISPRPTKPKSLYPSAIIAFAMVARGRDRLPHLVGRPEQRYLRIISAPSRLWIGCFPRRNMGHCNLHHHWPSLRRTASKASQEAGAK